MLYLNKSRLNGFYVTNIVTIVFEFPLHNQLTSNLQNTMAVFSFELDLKIFHGDVACLRNNSEKFKICWSEKDVDNE